MGNRAYSALAIHYTSRFSFHGSFSIILITSTVHGVARAEKEKKRLGVAGKCACGWQWRSGYLETVETSNSSIFTVIWEVFSEKKPQTNKKKPAWCRHGQRVKCLLTTAESRTALLFLAFALITCSYVILLFQPCCSGAKTKRPHGTKHLLCALTMKKANVSRNKLHLWHIPAYVLLCKANNPSFDVILLQNSQLLNDASQTDVDSLIL